MTTTVDSKTAAVASTSTLAPASKKIQVRAKGGRLTAQQVRERTRVWLPGQQLQVAQPGDYLISRADEVVDVVRVLSSDYDLIEEGLLIPDSKRADLERVLGLGCVHSPDALVKAVDRLARLEIGGVLVDFTPGQWEELKRKAAVQSQTVEVYLTRMVKKFSQDLWNL